MMINECDDWEYIKDNGGRLSQLQDKEFAKQTEKLINEEKEKRGIQIKPKSLWNQIISYFNKK